MGRTDYLCDIGPDKKPWEAGIFAIEHTASGRRLYAASRCVGKRVWDMLDWLQSGVHKNEELQRDWSADPQGFRVVLVDLVGVPSLLGFIKQCWIDRDRRDLRPGPYNRKNSVAQHRPTPSATSLSLPPDFFYEPPPPPQFNAYDRVIKLLGKDAFSTDVRETAAMPSTGFEPDREKAVDFLLRGLPSVETDRESRVDELLRRVQELQGQPHGTH